MDGEKVIFLNGLPQVVEMNWVFKVMRLHKHKKTQESASKKCKAIPTKKILVGQVAPAPRSLSSAAPESRVRSASVAPQQARWVVERR